MNSVGNGISTLNSALDAHSGIMEQLITSLMQPFPSSVIAAQQADLQSSLRSSALQEQGIGQMVDAVA